MTAQSAGREAGNGLSGLYDPRVRGMVYQVALVGALVLAAWAAGDQAVQNMAKRGIPLNFSFWNETAGFEINQTLISYSALSTYGRAFWVGLLNTLLVGAIGIVFATIIGFIVGLARLSSNWIVSKLATGYVELIRNIPLLLQLLFWYNAVLKALPVPRQSVSLFGSVFLNNRGLVLPSPVFAGSAWLVGIALLLGVMASIGVALWAKRRQMRTGEQAPVIWICLALTVGVPLIAYLALGRPIGLELPQLKGFNFVGGKQVFPELAALVLGLSIYTASFIAEIVRAGIQSVARGQREAAEALGLRANHISSQVVVPQALRVIIPPLTNQYLNLIKNSSLAVFIGYPDLVQVFAGTVLNQTGAAVQVMAITMAVYLAISLVTSFAMNIYNRRVALVER